MILEIGHQIHKMKSGVLILQNTHYVIISRQSPQNQINQTRVGKKKRGEDHLRSIVIDRVRPNSNEVREIAEEASGRISSVYDRKMKSTYVVTDPCGSAIWKVVIVVVHLLPQVFPLSPCSRNIEKILRSDQGGITHCSPKTGLTPRFDED